MPKKVTYTDRKTSIRGQNIFINMQYHLFLKQQSIKQSMLNSTFGKLIRYKCTRIEMLH